MGQIKRQRSESFYNFHEKNDRKRFLPLTTNDVTQFEHLANELIYEIFDYLNFYHIYESFFNLNHRFRSLLIESTFPLTINLFLMPKTTFNHYNEDIIQSNKQRIHIFRISNYFMFDKNTFIFSQMTSLQTLMIETVRSVQVKEIIQQLIFLPNLSSLSLSTINAIENIDFIYKQIFRLTSLRYCKLSLSRKFPRKVLPLTVNQYSSIEYLIIDHGLGFDELTTLLLYLPNLQHLKTCIWHRTDFILKLPFPILNHLTHVSFKLYGSIPFNDLELFLINYCSSIQFLRLSTYQEIFNANRWKQLISSSLPKLEIFDIKCKIHLPTDILIKQEMKLFNSLFWTKRQWFFECCTYSTKYQHNLIFYSINPFRRKKYRLCEQLNKRINFNSVKHIEITNFNSIDKNMFHFPNVIKLTLENKVFINDMIIINNLRRILPLKQIQMLEILCDHLCLLKMCELLSYMPNIHTLTFRSISLNGYGKKYLEQNQLFRLISKINLIKSIHFYGKCTLQNLELIVKLFPYLQYIQTSTELPQIQLILQYLLNKNNTNTRHLKLLCFSCDGKESHYVSKLIKSKLLPQDCKTIFDDQRLKLYIWW